MRVSPLGGVAYWGDRRLTFHLDADETSTQKGDRTISQRASAKSISFHLSTGFDVYSTEFLVALAHSVIAWYRFAGPVPALLSVQLRPGLTPGQVESALMDNVTDRRAFFVALCSMRAMLLDPALIAHLVEMRMEVALRQVRDLTSVTELIQRCLAPTLLPFSGRVKLNDTVWWYLFRTAFVFNRVVSARRGLPVPTEPTWLPMSDEQITGQTRPEDDTDEDDDDLWGPQIIDGAGGWVYRTGYEFFTAAPEEVANAVASLDGFVSSLTEGEALTLGRLIENLFYARALHFDESATVSMDLVDVFASYPNLGVPPFLETGQRGEFSPLPVGFFIALERELSALKSLESIPDLVSFCGGAFDAALVAVTPNSESDKLTLSRASQLKAGDEIELTELVSRPWLNELITGDLAESEGFPFDSPPRDVALRMARQHEEAYRYRVTFSPAIGNDYDLLVSDTAVLFTYTTWRRAIMNALRDYYTDPQYGDMPLSWYLNLSTP